MVKIVPVKIAAFSHQFQKLFPSKRHHFRFLRLSPVDLGRCVRQAAFSIRKTYCSLLAGDIGVSSNCLGAGQTPGGDYGLPVQLRLDAQGITVSRNPIQHRNFQQVKQAAEELLQPVS